MNLTTLVTTLTLTLTLSSLIAAAPLPNTSRRNLVPGLPTPMDLIEMMYPHSGIPKLASKVEGELHICMFLHIILRMKEMRVD